MERFERPRLPVVITGLCDSWRASKDWNEQSLVQRFGSHKFKVCTGPAFYNAAPPWLLWVVAIDFEESQCRKVHYLLKVLGSKEMCCGADWQ